MRVLICLLPLLFLAPALAQTSPKPIEEAPLPPKVQVSPAEEDAPAVNIRRDEATGDVVEEYRVNGRLQMVKVTPQRGPSYQLLDTNGDGKLDRSDYEGNVRPVYWTLYEWN
jgi:hypothetical protein